MENRLELYQDVLNALDNRAAKFKLKKYLFNLVEEKIKDNNVGYMATPFLLNVANDQFYLSKKIQEFIENISNHTFNQEDDLTKRENEFVDYAVVEIFSRAMKFLDIYARWYKEKNN